MNAADLVEQHTGRRPTNIEAVRTSTKPHGVWRCDDNYFVKIGTRDNFRIEAEAHEVASAAGIAVPEIVAVGSDYLISRTVRGLSLDDERIGPHERRRALEQAGRYLHALHEVVRPGFGWPDGDELRGGRGSWIEHVEAQLDWSASALVDVVDIDRVRATFDARRDLIADVERGSVLHGDFGIWHILVDLEGGGVTLIDWADAQIGDPLWDVAVLASWVPDAVDPLLSGYEPDASFRDRIDTLLPFYRAYRHMWGYRAGVEEGWDESARIPILKEIIGSLDEPHATR